MDTKISNSLLEQLGFRREEVSEEESGSTPFVYYSLGIENVSFISSAWEDQRKGVEEYYTVSFLESDILLDKFVLESLIKNLKDGFK